MVRREHDANDDFQTLRRIVRHATRTRGRSLTLR
jgi:hypothetical protein